MCLKNLKKNFFVMNSKNNGKKKKKGRNTDMLNISPNERVILKPVRVINGVHLGISDLIGILKNFLPPITPCEGVKPCMLIYVHEDVVEYIVDQLKFSIKKRWIRKDIGEGVQLSLTYVVVWIGSNLRMMQNLSGYYNDLLQKQTVVIDQIFNLGEKMSDEARAILNNFSGACSTHIHFSFQEKIIVIDPRQAQNLSFLRRSQVKLLKKKFRGCVKLKTLFLVLSAMLAILYLMSLVFGDSLERAH